MLRTVILSCAIFCWICLTQAQVTKDEARIRYVRQFEEARSALHAAAASLPLFDAEAFVYLRRPHLAPSINELYRHTLSDLIKADFGSEQLIQLLGDPQARVRTLAMALLFQKEDPKLLRYMLLDDKADTFPAPILTDNLPEPMPTHPQTVAEIAKTMTGAYMISAGMKNWRDPTAEDLGQYLAAHRARSYYFSWFDVRLSRVTGLISPLQEDRRPALLKFREELDTLPRFDRDLYLLWLCNGRFDFGKGYNSVLATQDELLEAAQHLGHQALLQIVDGRPPGTDPDLASNLLRYRGVALFILEHSDKLFSRADEPFLRAIEQGERDRISRGANEALEPVPVEAYTRALALLPGPAR
jgi:hypothetical protein